MGNGRTAARDDRHLHFGLVLTELGSTGLEVLVGRGSEYIVEGSGGTHGVNYHHGGYSLVVFGKDVSSVSIEVGVAGNLAEIEYRDDVVEGFLIVGGQGHVTIEHYGSVGIGLCSVIAPALEYVECAVVAVVVVHLDGHLIAYIVLRLLGREGVTDVFRTINVDSEGSGNGEGLHVGDGRTNVGVAILIGIDTGGLPGVAVQDVVQVVGGILEGHARLPREFGIVGKGLGTGSHEHSVQFRKIIDERVNGHVAVLINHIVLSHHDTIGKVGNLGVFVAAGVVDEDKLTLFRTEEHVVVQVNPRIGGQFVRCHEGNKA